MEKMKSEGKVMNRQKFNQLPIFENLRFVVPGKRNECGVQSPTDIDLHFEFQKKIRITVEYKKEGNDMPNGQERTLTSDIDMTRYPFAFLLVATHNIPDNKDYDAADCIVQKIYAKIDSNDTIGEWIIPNKKRTVKEWFIDLFQACNIDLQDFDEYENQRKSNVMDMLNNLTEDKT